jgi:hypothetical protein
LTFPNIHSFFQTTWLVPAVLSFTMHLFSVAALLSVPFLSSAAPLEDVYGSKGYEMGVFYVNWVRHARYLIRFVPNENRPSTLESISSPISRPKS